LALKQSEERFKKMFERHGAIMLLIDPETGDIIDGNQAATEFYGYTKEQLTQQNICDINMLETLRVRDFLQRALHGDMDMFVFPHRLRNGEERMVEVHSAPIDFQGRIILYSIIHDITDRWHAEMLLQQKTAEIEAQNEEFIQLNEELNQSNNELINALTRAEGSEERFKLAMNASNDGLFDWNLITNEIYYSPGWKRMLGYEDNELPNDFSIWENLTEAADVRRSWEMQRKLINKEIDRFVMEFKMKHKNGHWIDVLSRAEAIFNKQGVAVRIVGTHVDVTARKRAEASLSRSENRYRLLHENAGLGIGYFTADGTIISFNKIAAALMGGKP
jgi:PAS domain S-box-containing protein